MRNSKFLKLMHKRMKEINEGKKFTSVSIMGTPHQRAVLVELEQLRRNYLLSEDKLTQIESKNTTAIASVAHDMKTPLAIISGYAESIQAGVAEENYPELIINKVSDMNDMVVSLVETARMESQTNEDRIEKIDVRLFFGSELVKYYQMAKESKIELSVSHIPNVSLYANREIIARIIQNLISNAIKYTNEGGKIKVRFVIRASTMYMSVKDSGIGIPKQALPYVFDKFYMVNDPSRTNIGKTKSSGLGLYAAKQMALNYGGNITVRSKENVGSTFTLVLPVENLLYDVCKSFTQRVDSLDKSAKFLIWLLFGWIFSAIYRFIKFGEKRQRHTLIGGLFLIPFFLVGWFTDLINILINNDISFLAN